MNHTIAILAATAALSSPPSAALYTTLGKSALPCNRILHGLWQTSGGWGEIKQTPAVEALVALSKSGFQTFDGADHYGPSEVLMGLARESLSTPQGAEVNGGIFFTKWCPSPRAYTPSEVAAAVDKSRTRMKTPTLDLLQLHWWDYGQREELRGVLEALRVLQSEGKVRELGLTNFDSAHVVWMVDQLKLPIASNQVQFSLVDSRPLARMSPACEARGVKLLTYGTLLGGLLSDKYLGKPEPTKSQLSTPSLGKYYNVSVWGKEREREREIFYPPPPLLTPVPPSLPLLPSTPLLR